MENASEVQNKLFDFYLKGYDKTDKRIVEKKLAEVTVHCLFFHYPPLQFVGDSWFNIGALDAARSCAKHGNNVYLASFDYYNKENEKDSSNRLPFKGAAHGADLKYTLGNDFILPFNPVKEELDVMNLIGTMVTNFAKYG